MTQANRLLNELQDAKIIRRVKRTPGTFEHVLLAGQLVASTPIGANGEMQYSTAMKRWGIAQKERYDVRSWAQRFKQLFERRKKNADVREFFAPRARVEAQGPSGAGAAAPCAANAHGDHLSVLKSFAASSSGGTW